MKTVLITGANSYIGTSFEEYVANHYSDQLTITTIDMIDGSWRSQPFTTLDESTGEQRPYDVVFHVAGLAHADVGKVSDEVKAKYYAVNTDLAIECAKKAKADGVGQFIFMSSAIIYGDSAPYGKKKTVENNNHTIKGTRKHENSAHYRSKFIYRHKFREIC